MIFMKVLEVDSISKKYNKKVILENISFTINAGEVVGLVGPNGAGKSTLMKILVDIVKSDKGKVMICDLDIKKERDVVMEKTSFLIEEPSLYDSFTVEEFFKLNAYLRNINEKNLKDAFEYLGNNFNTKKKIKKLSLGMKQEVALATCFMNDSQLYIFDEPINGLDFSNVLKFRKKIAELKTQNKSVIISSHILKELEVMVDYYLFLNKGMIIVVGKDDDIEKKYQDMFNEESIF